MTLYNKPTSPRDDDTLQLIVAPSSGERFMTDEYSTMTLGEIGMPQSDHVVTGLVLRIHITGHIIVSTLRDNMR